MATIKVACPKCGQKVSGDETFAGTSVSCPVCSSEIRFPGEVREGGPTGVLRTEDYSPAPNKPRPPSACGRPTGVLRTEDYRPGEANGPVEIPETLPDVAEAAPQARQETSRIEPEDPESGGDENGDEEEEPELVVPSPVTGAVSLVAGVLGIVVCGIGGILFSPVAIIFGHLSQAKARHSPVQPAPGQTLGAIGMLIGYVWLVITILVLGVLVAFEEPIRELIQSRR